MDDDEEEEEEEDDDDDDDDEAEVPAIVNSDTLRSLGELEGIFLGLALE